ncbi:MAG: hypothetical protein ACRDMV_25235 [Streptosporangiales bacterium]
MTAYLITEPVRVETCPRCDATVLHAHTGGVDTRVDPEHLNANNELTALLQSRMTFDLIQDGYPPRFYLEWRDADRIQAGRKHIVVARHTCERKSGPGQRQEPGPFLTLPIARQEDTDIPPF